MSVMGTTVPGCKFCEIVMDQKHLHLKETTRTVVIRDIKPKASHHFLALSKAHINKPTDLTAADIPLLEEMEKSGRDYLRQELKKKGEADTVEDMLRIGFHWPPLITVKHLHMHFIYPIRDLSILSRMVTFRPGKAFRAIDDVIKELREKQGIPDPLEGNPAKEDNPQEVSAHAVVN